MKKLWFLIFLGILYSTSLFSEEIKLPVEATHFDSAVVWSPDSSQIAIGAQGNLYIIDASSGEISKTIAIPGFVLDIDWNPDGKKMAISHSDEVTVHYPTDILIVDLNDGTAENITHSKPYTYCRTPKWSPDGRFIVFTFEKRDTILHEDTDEFEHVFTEEVATMNVDTGHIDTLSTGCCPAWSKDHHKLIISSSYDAAFPDYVFDYDEDSQKLLPDTKTLITGEQKMWLLDPDSVNSKWAPEVCDGQYVSPDGQKLIIKKSTSPDYFVFVLKKK